MPKSSVCQIRLPVSDQNSITAAWRDKVGVTDHFKTSQPGSNQNWPLRGALFISEDLMLARGFSISSHLLAEHGLCDQISFFSRARARGRRFGAPQKRSFVPLHHLLKFFLDRLHDIVGLLARNIVSSIRNDNETATRDFCDPCLVCLPDRLVTLPKVRMRVSLPRVGAIVELIGAYIGGDFSFDWI
jgi:hypothetical protein